MNWDPSLSWTRTQTQKNFFFHYIFEFFFFSFFSLYFWRKLNFSSMSQKLFEKPNTKTILKPGALSVYSLISKPLFSHGWNSNHGDPIPLSFLSSQTRALSLLSWPIHLMTKNPWPIIFSKSMDWLVFWCSLLRNRLWVLVFLILCFNLTMV